MRLETSRHRLGGFTLIEIVIATALVGLALVAMMTSVGSNTRVNDAGTKLTQGTFLAQEIREWTLSLPFRDQDAGDLNSPPGPDGSSPQVWVDDIDDMMNVTYCPPRDGQGYAIASLPAWSQTITITWMDPNDLSGTVADGTSEIIYVNVDVKHRNTVIVSSGWLVTKKPTEQ